MAAEVVITNKSTVRMNGKSATPEEKADFLLRHGYPVPTTNREELVELIAKQTQPDIEESKLRATLPERLLPQANTEATNGKS